MNLPLVPVSRHYEKIVSLCCFLSMFCNIGLVSTSFNVFQPYIVALPGIGDTNGSMILAFRNLVSLVTLLFVDRYYNALGCRVGMSVSCLLTAAGFVSYSLASSMPLFALGSLLCGIGYGLGGMVCVTMLTKRWYRAKIGTAIGFAAVGSGVAGVVMPMVVVRIIHAASLGAAFLTSACIAASVGALVFLLVRNNPADLDAQPYDLDLAAPGKPGGRTRRRMPPTERVDVVRLPLRTSERLLLMVAMVFVGAMSIGGVTYTGVLFSSEGYDELFVAMLLSLTGACLTAGKFATGELFDLIGTRKGTAVMFAFAIAGLVLLLLAPLGIQALSVLGCSLMGVGISLGTVGISVWSLDFSQPHETGRTVKNYQVGYALGGLLMNALPGPLKDLTGSYLVSYAVLAVFAACAAAIILRAYGAHAVKGDDPR